MGADTHVRASARLRWRAHGDAASFLTRSPTGAPRTSGVVVQVSVDDDVVLRAARLARFATPGPADASGKVAVIVDAAPLPVVHVFQHRDDGSLAPAWCGNALAAAAAFTGCAAVMAIGPGRREACVSVGARAQVWTLPGAPQEPEGFVAADGSEMWSSHVLNDYIAVEAPTRAPVPTGNGKTVTIDFRVDGEPFAMFGTAAGERAAAPLTGLAELRVLAHSERFQALDRAGAVRLRDGSVEKLPELEIGAASFSFELPGRVVELTPIVLAPPS